MVAAVEQHVVAFAAEDHAGGSAAVAGFELALGIEADVAQDQRDLVGNADAVFGILDHQRAVEAEAHLGRRHHVRVIPIQPGVADDEVVGERLTRLHLGLRYIGHAVHFDRHAHAVPVHGGWVLQLVLEVNDQPVADAGLDQRSGQAAVIGPGLHALARRDLHLGELGRQGDLDHLGVGIGVDGLAQLEVRVPSGGRQ